MLTGKLKKPATPRSPAAATDVRFDRDRFVVALADGREISVPLEFYPTLSKASSADRLQWELIGRGRGISWESLDLDLSVQGLLEGAHEYIPHPPKLPQSSAGKSSRRKSA